MCMNPVALASPCVYSLVTNSVRQKDFLDLNFKRLVAVRYTLYGFQLMREFKKYTWGLQICDLVQAAIPTT